MTQETKNCYGLHDLAKVADVNKEALSRVFRSILEILASGATVRVRDFGTFNRTYMKGRMIKSPVLDGGEAEFKGRWLLKLSAHNSAKLELNKLIAMAKAEAEAAESEKKPKGKKSKGKKSKTKPTEPEVEPEAEPEVEPEAEAVKAAKTPPKAAKASPKAKGKPRKASSGVKKAS